MNTKKNELGIMTLSEDIRNIVNRAGKGQLELMRFCKDHSNPYLMDDNNPVFNDLSQDQFLGIFDFGPNHFFLIPEQLSRFGIYCKLRVYNIIALMVKSEWEKFYFNALDYENKSSAILETELKDNHLVEKHISDFNPDKDRIYTVIQKVPNEKSSDISRGNVNLIVDDMIKEGYFLSDNRFMDDYYPEAECNEKLLLKNASDITKNKYAKLKLLWKKKTTEVEEKLYDLENRKRINQNLEDIYFRTFGALDLEKTALKYKVEKFNLVLKIKRESPEISIKKALNKAIESLSEMEDKSRILKNTYMRSLNCISSYFGSGGSKFSQNDVTNYKEAIKSLLKKIYFLMHSDTCPVKNLSDEQKSGIKELWLELMSSKDELFSYSPGMLMWSFPDYARLLSILTRACKILEINVEDLDVADRLELMIKKGMPIEKIILFLENDVKNLQLHLTNLEIVQYEYTNEKESQMHRIALENVENHNEKYTNDIVKLKNQILELRSKVKARFQKVLMETEVID